MNHVPAFLKRLALDDGADERSIRRAYAREVKQIDPEADPAGFQVLREAYEAAMQWARWKLAQIAEGEGDALLPESAPMEVAAEAYFEARAEAVAGGPINVCADAHAAPRTLSPGEPVLGALLPDEVAAAVFSDFQSRMAPLVTAADWNSDAVHKRELEAALRDSRLTHLAARDLFEWHVARTLAAGWQPGHEALHVAATRVFNWNQDRRGLMRFGQVGDILNRSLDERAIYDQLPEATKTAQREIIARLRDPAPPSRGELINKLTIADAIVRRYPTWVPLVTNLENLRTWHLRDRDVPGWRRSLAAKAKWYRELHPVQKWLLAVLIFGSLITMCSGSHGTDRRQPTLASDPAILQEAKDAAQAEYKILYRQIIEGSPTADKCEDAAMFAHRLGVDRLASGTGFGPVFDDRVVACARAGFWPIRRASIGILQIAEARVRLRNAKADM
jgi:protein TonB